MKMVEVEMLPTTLKTKLSFIITAKPNQNYERPLRGINHLVENHSFEWEIIIAQGYNPSQQRNEASLIASGDYLVFFDDDSFPQNDYIVYLMDAFRFEPDLAVVGGISEVEHDKSAFQKSIKYVFASVFGIGFLRARYTSIGKVRYSTEKELIMSNLVVKRDAYFSVGGLNNNLFPNEENELLNRLRKIGKICYHPLLTVKRPPRKNLRELIYQMLSYGIGRTRHFLMVGKRSDLIYFIPAIFSLYLIFLPLLIMSFSKISSFMLLPLMIYLILNLLASYFNFITIKNKSVAIRLPFLFFLCHISYGSGLVIGFFKKTKKNESKEPIKLISIYNGFELEEKMRKI